MKKQLMTAIASVAIMAFAVSAFAGSGVVKDSFNVGKAQTVYTNVIDFGGSTYKQIDQIAFYNEAAVGCSNLVQLVYADNVYVYCTSNSATADNGTITYPERTVAWGDITATKPLAQKLRVFTYLFATNGVAETDVLDFEVFIKDP